jgi:hypothetical protein
MGMGHDNEGTEKGRVGSKRFLKEDRYECDKGKEINPMEYVSNNGASKSRLVFFFFFTHVELHFGLKNISVMKCPNA